MDAEKKKQLKIEVKDLEVVTRFFNHFNIDMPDHLTEALEGFKNDPSIKTQDALTLALTKSLSERKEQINELDDLFKPVVEACEEVSYNLQFDKDFEDTVGIDEDGAKTSSSETAEKTEPTASSDSQEPASS